MTHHQRSQTALFAHTLSIKGKRLSRLFAMLLIGIGLLAGIASPAAAESTPARFDSAAIDRVQPTVSDAPDSDSDTGDRPNHDASTDSHTGETGSRNAPGGGLDGASYTGVNFDWSVTWDGVVWEAPADREDNSGGADYFQLGSTRKDGAPPMVVAIATMAISEPALTAPPTGWRKTSPARFPILKKPISGSPERRATAQPSPTPTPTSPAKTARSNWWRYRSACRSMPTAPSCR